MDIRYVFVRIAIKRNDIGGENTGLEQEPHMDSDIKKNQAREEETCHRRGLIISSRPPEL